MRTIVACATLVDFPLRCALWRTLYEIGNNLTGKRALRMGLRAIYA